MAFFLNQLIGNHGFDLKIVAICLGITYGKFYNWYKESLSGFRNQEVQKSLHKYDFSTSNGKNIAVPICRKEEFGSNMLVDEKHINSDFYTVFSNEDSGKVALMLQTVNPAEIGQFLGSIEYECKKVEVISRDMSGSYQSVCDTNFAQAAQVVDKFHVIAKGIDHLQDLRNDLKKKELDFENKRESERKKLLKELKTAEKSVKNTTEKKAKKSLEAEVSVLLEKLENLKLQSITTGESKVEMLNRSRYLLYKEPEKWTSSQKERANILFDNFPNLAQYHTALSKFRTWYKPDKEEDKANENFEWKLLHKETQLEDWIETYENTKITELKTFVKTVKRHQEGILLYHKAYKTNAKAESINSKIEDAKRKNRGTRDLDFFFFRLEKII